MPYAVWPNGLRTRPRITSGWNGYPGHQGLDMADFNINYAVLAGLVVYAQWSIFGGGWIVEILADNGDLHRYLHNREGLIVVKGQRVKTGQALAYQGNSGRSFGKHLHFAVRLGGIGGKYTDPLPYLIRLIGTKAAGGITTTPLTTTDQEQEENAMDVRYLHRIEGAREWMIVGAKLGLDEVDPKQDGYRVTLDVLTAEAWGAVYGTATGDSWKGLTRRQYNQVQINARKIAADYRRLLKA